MEILDDKPKCVAEFLFFIRFVHCDPFDMVANNRTELVLQRWLFHKNKIPVICASVVNALILYP